MSTQTAELTSHRDLTPVLDKLSALAISRPNRYDKAQSSPAASPPPDYLKHQKEWNTMSADFEARMKWLDNLEADRGLKYVDTFLKYMREHPEPPRSQVKEVANDAFMSWLNEADWIHNNEALGIVNERLWSRYISAKPNLYIGCYQDAVLALRLNGRALDPPKADIATCKKYAITSINPHSLLAIRYKPLDEKDRVERVFLFVTLGKSVCIW